MEASAMRPDVLYLILCDRIDTDPENYHRCNTFGLVTTIRSVTTPAFPVVHPSLRALLVWTGCTGTGELAFRIAEEASGRTICRVRPRLVRLVGDPAAVGGVVFRTQNCVFPAPGLYWAEVILDGQVIARQRLLVKSPESFP
jgi:hypothetical protein